MVFLAPARQASTEMELTACSCMPHLEVLVLEGTVGPVYRKDARTIVIDEVATCAVTTPDELRLTNIERGWTY